MGELIARVTDLPVDQVICENRLRPVSEAGVTALMESIVQVGAMKDDIHVRKVGSGSKARFILIAGGHRLEAAKRLGWDHVPAKLWHCTADWARLLEIDDNLASADLSALELATFLAERKRVHLKLHPQTAQGQAGAKARWGDATDTVSFASSVAEKRDISVRHVERLIRIGETLTPDQLAALQALPTPPAVRDLIALSKETAETRAEVFSRLSSGADGLKAAMKAASPSAATTPASSDADRDFVTLQEAWARAGNTGRRRFLYWAHAEIARLMAEPQA